MQVAGLATPPATDLPDPTSTRTLVSHGGMSLELDCAADARPGGAGVALTMVGPPTMVVGAVVGGSTTVYSSGGPTVVSLGSSFGPLRGDFNAADTATGAVLNGSFYARPDIASCISRASAIAGP